MKVLKGKKVAEKHHWWPECVSQHWANSEGKVHWIRPSGEIVQAPPAQFGAIRNAHYIQLGNTAGETTDFDQNFEPFFDSADQTFPSVITWLSKLPHEKNLERPMKERFWGHLASDEELAPLLRGIVSLAIRCPMSRASAVGMAEQMRGEIPAREREALIALNMRDSYQNAIKMIGNRGVYGALFSPDKEFIYGDGFYHNLNPPIQPFGFSRHKLLVPVTPNIAVLYTQPMSYRPEPRLFTLVLSAEETKLINDAVQIYSKDSIFYRNEIPEILPEYKQQIHLQYADNQHFIEYVMQSIPTITDRGPFFRS